MKKFYVIALIFLAFSPPEICSASKSKKKTHKTTTEGTTIIPSQPAILAIEIVDPKENSTSAKHNKRTIDGSLGYGYNNFEAKPRYEVYKYSQHDIPAFKGDTSKLQISSSNPVNVQKSVQYSLPTVSQQVTATSNIIQPGTTLYSSLSDKGQVGSLSTTLPDVPSLENSNVPVPVVVLRIYPYQLKDSTIQANLPKRHPFAKSINSLNIQTLLLQYIKTLKNPGILSQYSINQESFRQDLGSGSQYSANKGLFGQGHGSSSQYSSGLGSRGQNNAFSNQYSTNQGSSGQYHKSANQDPTSQTPFGRNQGYSSQYFTNLGSSGHNTYTPTQSFSTSLSTHSKSPQTNHQTDNYYQQESYQNTPKYQSNNGGSQNYMYYQQSYPQQSTQEYTRQSQYQQQQYPEYNSDVTVVQAPIKYQINPYQTGSQWRYETSSIQKPQETQTASPTPQPEYYYVQPSAQNSDSTESSNYYLPPQKLEYTKPSVHSASVPQQQYYTTNDDSQYSGYTQDVGQQYEEKNQLLTFENYPTNKHTRVVFRTKTGDVRTPESEQTPAEEVKTIKIHVPENIAKVEVQETERPYYAPEPAHTDSKQGTKEPEIDTYQPIEALEKENPQQNYYLPPSALRQYYNNEQSASELFLNYQNVNYGDMAKYFEKRGAMPKYFFQSPEEGEAVTELSTEGSKDINGADDTKDIISTYEEVAFPSTTSSPVKKKAKSKKRVSI